MWFLPSRKRSDNIKRFFDAFKETNSTTPGVLWLDDDDSHNYDSIEIPKNWQKIVSPRMSGLGDMTNKFYELFPNEPWYGLIGDDVLPKTASWDKILVEAAGKDNLAWADDGMHGGNYAVHPVIGADLVKKLGFLGLAGAKRLYIDNALFEFAKRNGALKYVPYVKLEHLHFSNGKSQIDETYIKDSHFEDEIIYNNFLRTLNKKVNFVCVNWGNYCGRGKDYVNILYDSVIRNITHTDYITFTCFTDDKTGLNENIIARDLPEGVFGWWNKLYLFKEDLFDRGERIIFIDLDTVITSNIDDIVNYIGDFATLRDFYYPERVGPAFMLWEAGTHCDIWNEWVTAGKPIDMPLGDLSWINSIFAEKNFSPKILQDIFPKIFVSYKVDCVIDIPQEAKVICFHGEPRPHNCENELIAEIWKIDGRKSPDFKLSCNVSNDQMWSNIVSNSYRTIKWFDVESANDKNIIICGGGPSLAFYLPIIKAYQDSGFDVMSMNGSLNHLQDRGLIPQMHIMIDSREDNKIFVEKAPSETKYYIASQVHPDIFDILKDKDVTLFHISIPKMYEFLKDDIRARAMIGGGRTVGLNAIVLAAALGYRNIHLIGYDSCYEDNYHHAYKQKLNDGENLLEIQVSDRKFLSSPWMVQQVRDFQDVVVPAMIDMGVKLTVHGDGLLPFIAEQISTTKEI